MESKGSVEDDNPPVSQETADDEDNLSDMDSHPGSERDAVSEAGSETPSLSDKSSLRNSRSASNTPTNTRSTRSRDNPEFVAKQKSFMAKVQAASTGVESPMARPDTPGKRKRYNSASSSQGSTKKRKFGKTDNNGQDYQNDNYCWECHREGVFICCEMCPRVFHLKCAGMEKEPEEDWACSECHAVMQAENIENRSRAMQLISVEQLCTLLKFALNRLKTMAGMEPFTKPVDVSEFPTYEDVVVHPVDFTSLERNIKRKFYGSTEAFSSDARWIVHNSVIFNGANSKVTSMARSLVKILKQDMSEIETCPDCYMNAHQKPKTWFIEACRSAHPLIWARLKGFPFWPAKAVKWKDGNVDVRFFGRHDRSWVPVKECFLFSEQMPTPLKNRNKTLESCLQEVNEHIVKLRERFGKFKYAPHRVQFNPQDQDQIKILLPNYKTPAPVRVRSQSRAFSRLSGHSDDETSSIASTDSGASVRRRKRESGTSSATQETETEAEIPGQVSEQGDEEGTENDMKEDAKMEPDEEDKHGNGEEDEEEEGKLRMEMKVDEEEIEEDGEEFGEYPVGRYGDDDGNEDGEDLGVMNGLTSSKNENYSKKEESDDEHAIDGDHGGIGKEEVEEEEEEKEFEKDKLPVSGINNERGGGGEEEEEEDEEDEDDAEKVLEKVKLLVSEINNEGEEEQEKLLEKVKLITSGISNEGKEEKELEDRLVSSVVDNEEEIDEEEEDRLLASPKQLTKEKAMEESDQEEHEVQKAEEHEVRKAEEHEREAEEHEQKAEEHEVRKAEEHERKAEEHEQEEEEHVPEEDEQEPEEDEQEPEEDEQEPEDDEQEQEEEEEGENEDEEEELEEGEEDLGKLALSQSTEGEDMNEENNSDEETKVNPKISETATAQADSTKDVEADISKRSDENSDVDDQTDESEPEDESMEIESQATSLSLVMSSLKGVTVQVKRTERTDKDQVEEKENIDRDNVHEERDSEESMLAKIRRLLKAQSEHLESEEEGEDEVEEEGRNKLKEKSGADSADESEVNKDKERNTDSLKRKTDSLSDNLDFDRTGSEEKRQALGGSSGEESDQGETTEEKEEGRLKGESVIRSSSSLSEDRKAEYVSAISFGDSMDFDDENSRSKKDEQQRSARESVLKVVESERSDQDTDKAKSSLLDAVQLMKSMGTIAITRVDGKTLDQSTNEESEEKTSAEDSNQDPSVSRKESPPLKSSDRDMEQHISSLGCSVSVTKAVDKDRDKEKEKEKEKVKMPSGVDTTRLSPSISIIAVAGEKQRGKTTVAPSTTNENQNSSTVSSQSAPRSSPAFTSQIHPRSSPSSSSQNHPRSSPSSSSQNQLETTTSTESAVSVLQKVSSATSQANSAAGIPPPPPLSHPPTSQSCSVASRGIFGPPPPGSQVLGMPGARGHMMSSPGLRMMGNSGGMMVPPRLPGGPPGLPPSRHLPPEAGPLSSQLHKHSQKLAEVMRATLEDVLAGLVGTGTPEARLAALQLELERTSWRHQQELAEVRHNADVMLVEMRANLEAEKQRAVEEVRRQMEQQMVEVRRQMERQMVERLAEVRRQTEAEKQRAVEETKKKQWCANCGKEALFFCCWNTSYCDYPCQQSHWPQHMGVCGQNSDSGGGEGGPDSVNGEASGHSSRVSTPQNLVMPQHQFGDEEGANALAEEVRRRKQRENQSPMYGDMSMMNRGSPAVPGSMNTTAGVPPVSPNMSALSPGGRAGMANLGGPAMAAMAAMAAGSAGNQGGHAGMHGMKMPRYMPPNIMQQQQQMYGGVDPRMMMMMGRGMPPGAAAAMMRNPMHHFRPRFM